MPCFIIKGVVCGLGDVIAQSIIERKTWTTYDIPRTTKMASIGFAFTVKIILYPDTRPLIIHRDQF